MTAPLRLAALSDPGARACNEDAVRFGVLPGGGAHAVLCDGAGGHRRGAEAANLAADLIERTLADPSLAFSPANLSQVLRLAHLRVQRHQHGGAGPRDRMHCTAVALWIAAGGGHALWSHVGDSRLYRLRAGRIELMTADDSLVMQLVREGVIAPEQMQSHPARHQLLSALGVDGDVEPHTVVRPVEVCDGDAFLLCSDGWWEALGPARFDHLLRDADSPQRWLDMMRDEIATQDRPRQDNFSAIAIWVGRVHRDTAHADEQMTMPRARPISAPSAGGTAADPSAA